MALFDLDRVSIGVQDFDSGTQLGLQVEVRRAGGGAFARMSVPRTVTALELADSLEKLAGLVRKAAKR